MSRPSSTHAVDERTRLLDTRYENGGPCDDRPVEQYAASLTGPQSKDQWKKNLILLLGVLFVNSDSAILLAIFRQVGSEFGALSLSSWVINIYLLGVIVSQPLFGKLSDIYGRKPLLLFSYICYCIGGITVGTALTFWQVLIGRAIAGIGNAGITVLVSTLIVELVPFKEVALWRSYVYTVNQIGRALGPSLGGLILDSGDWRWALLFQVPVTAGSIIFVWRKMDLPVPVDTKLERNNGAAPRRTKFQRIDFGGATTIALANASLLILLDTVQRNPNALHDLWAIIPGSLWIAFLAAFVLTEAFFAREPILPLRLMIRRSVSTAYSIQFFQTAAQTTLYTTIPLYFRVTKGESYTMIALRLMVMNIGTIFGGLISGVFIQKTGLYRLITWLFLALSTACYFTIFLRWRGNTGWLETLYIFPAGLGFGVSLSSAFIGLNARIKQAQTAVATSGFYLCLNLGSMCGLAVASVLIQSSMREQMMQYFQDGEFVKKLLSNLDNVLALPPAQREAVSSMYANSLVNIWLLALVCGGMALLTSLAMHEGTKDRDDRDEQRDAEERA